MNIKLKNIYPGVLTKPWPLRWSARFAILGAPVMLGYVLVVQPSRTKLNKLLTDMHQQLVTLGNDGNL